MDEARHGVFFGRRRASVHAPRPAAEDSDMWRAFALLGLLAAQPAALESSRVGRPHVVFVDVGQGSAALLVDARGRVVVLDGGPVAGSERLLRALRRERKDAGHQRVELWVHTHYDADHVGAFERVIDGEDGERGSVDDILVRAAWDRGDEAIPDNWVASRYLERAAGVRRRPHDGEYAHFDRVSVRALWPRVETPSGENDRGLALCVELGSLRLFVPGDLPFALQENVIADCGAPDIVWAGHHGAADGISPALDAAFGHATVVVSAGRDNAFCHPAADALRIWSARQVYVLDLANTGPGRCGDLAADWGEAHELVAGDLRFDAE